MAIEQLDLDGLRALRTDVAGRLEQLERNDIPERRSAFSAAEERWQDALAVHGPDSPRVATAQLDLNESRGRAQEAEATVHAMRRELARLDDQVRQRDLERAFREDFAPDALAGIAAVRRHQELAIEMGRNLQALAKHLTDAYSKCPGKLNFRSVYSADSMAMRALWFETLDIVFWHSRGLIRPGSPDLSREIAQLRHSVPRPRTLDLTVAAFPGLAVREGAPADVVEALRKALPEFARTETDPRPPAQSSLRVADPPFAAANAGEPEATPAIEFDPFEPAAA